MNKTIATFEKMGKPIKVVMDEKANLYLKHGDIKSNVLFIANHPQYGYFYEVSADFAIKVFNKQPPNKQRTIHLTDSSAKEAKELQERTKKEMKLKQDLSEINSLTDESKIKLAWGTDHSFIVGFSDNSILSEMLKKIEKSEIDIAKALGRKADETDLGDYSMTKYFKITFAELKKLVAEGEAEIAAKERMEAEKEEQRKIEEQKKFEEAKRTGKPVELSRYTTFCNNPNEECNIDIVVTYALPDGSIKTERIHTW
ncbi:hypothetical protein [Calidifontibacillus erzurumensis]|uniref:hypothetical protein n=1 Tax=Calidifontibacillus erzurumensis TaxID=2741433 RepID=UPI0035B55E01